MTLSTVSAQDRYTYRASISFSALVCLIICSCPFGCASRVFRPSNLPEKFEAPPVADVGTINWSRMADGRNRSELIERGDVLEVTLGSGFDSDDIQTAPVRVAADGTANILLVGKVSIAGLRMEEAEQAIIAASVGRQFYRNPTVTVTMKRRRTNVVTIAGAVEKPGTYELPRSKSSLVAALQEAGGLTDEADSVVEIHRASRSGSQNFMPGRRRPWREGQDPYQLTGHAPEQTVIFDLVTAGKQGTQAPALGDGDVITVRKKNLEPIRVLGLVKQPGEFELPSNHEIRVLDAIALAGGRTMSIANKVHVIRKPPSGVEPVVIVVNMYEAKKGGEANLRLAPGDIVSVDETPATWVVGTLKSIIRFGISSTIPLF